MFKKEIYSTNSVKNVYAVIAGCTTAVLIHLLTRFGIKESHYSFIIFFITCILFLYSTSKQKRYQPIIAHIILGMLLFLAGNFLYQLFLTYLDIPVWDFLCFYLFGNVGSSGLNFYDPNVFLQIFNDLNLQIKGNTGFMSEIVNVGFWYPPPSMFLFLPLALFDLPTSHVIWQTILILFLILDILLLLKYYPFKVNKPGNRKISNLLLLSSILLFPNLISSIKIGQTISIFLFFLILFLDNVDNWQAGLFLALLIVIKPLAAIFALYFLFFKKWRILTSFLFTGCLILIISLLFFGVDAFLVFFKSPPTARIPPGILYESANQSLHAVLLRAQLKLTGNVNFQSIKVITYVVSIFMILLTFYSSKLIEKKNRLLSFMAFIPMALLIYPNTLSSYTIILIPVVIYFFIQNPLDEPMNVVLLFFLYGTGFYNFFAFNLVLWFILIAWPLKGRFNLSGQFRLKLPAPEFDDKRQVELQQ